jgi:hypothetical protein
MHESLEVGCGFVYRQTVGRQSVTGTNAVSSWDGDASGGFDEPKTKGLYRVRVLPPITLLALSADASVSVAAGFLQFPFQRARGS